MPQMMPMKWLMFYFLFIMIYLILMNFIHFFKKPNMYNNNNMNKFFKMMWTWK